MWLWAYLNSDILLDVISMSHNEDTTRSQSLIGFKRSLHKPNRRAPCDSCSWPDDHPPDAPHASRSPAARDESADVSRPSMSGGKSGMVLVFVSSGHS